MVNLVKKKIFVIGFGVLVLCLFFGLGAHASSASLCKTSIFPVFFPDFESCAVTSGFSEVIEGGCVFTPSQVDLNVNFNTLVSIQCIVGTAITCPAGTDWNIMAGNSVYTGSDVELFWAGGDDNRLISSHDDFDLNTYKIRAKFNYLGEDYNCLAGISSSVFSFVQDDYYTLSVKTLDENDVEETVFVLGELTIKGEFTVNQAGSNLTTYFKDANGDTIYTQDFFPLGGATTTINYDITGLPVGNYIVGGIVEIGPGERFTANNKAEKFVSIVDVTQNVGVPEISPVFVVLIGFIVVFLIGKTPKFTHSREKDSI